MTVGVFFLSRVAPKRDDLGTSIVHRQRGSWGGKMPSDEALEFWQRRLRSEVCDGNGDAPRAALSDIDVEAALMTTQGVKLFLACSYATCQL